MSATGIPTPPVRVRGGCYHSCYYAQGRKCECACGGESHQSAFRGPRNEAERVGSGQVVYPESVLGDSRPADSTPPPPPPPPGVKARDGMWVVEDDDEPDEALDHEHEHEDEPERPTRQEAIDEALNRVAAGEFTHVQYRVAGDPADSYRQAIILATGTKAQEAFFRHAAERGEKVVIANGLFSKAKHTNIAAKMVSERPDRVWDERGRPFLANVAPDPEPAPAPAAPGVFNQQPATRVPPASGRESLGAGDLRGIKGEAYGRPAGWVRSDCEHIQSTGDAEMLLRQHGIKADLGEKLNANPDFLRGTTSALLDAHHKYPHLSTGQLPLNRVVALSALPTNDPIRKTFARKGSTHMAVVIQSRHNRVTGERTVTHTMVYNDYTPDRLKQLVGSTDLASSGWCVAATDSAYGVTMHEVGHSVAYAKWGIGSKRDIASKLRGIPQFQTIDGRKGVSRYAATDAHEFFAESFAAHNTPAYGGWGAMSPQTQAGLAEFERRCNEGADFPII